MSERSLQTSVETDGKTQKMYQRGQKVSHSVHSRLFLCTRAYTPSEDQLHKMLLMEALWKKNSHSYIRFLKIVISRLSDKVSNFFSRDVCRISWKVSSALKWRVFERRCMASGFHTCRKKFSVLFWHIVNCSLIWTFW